MTNHLDVPLVLASRNVSYHFLIFLRQTGNPAAITLMQVMCDSVPTGRRGFL